MLSELRKIVDIKEKEEEIYIFSSMKDSECNVDKGYLTRKTPSKI